MEKLPPEIVLNIANMIPRHEEFYNLARTCRGLWHVLRLVLIRRDIEKTCLHAPTAKLGDELSVSVGHTPALHHAIAHGQTENVRQIVQVFLTYKSPKC
ncbi:hypothetical protein B0T17DRAFT_535435 [Bombardia bombarda]|uniref:F-box domain-containing protein n=1 Tax=Bombardia bombarda TaxID=252184 RepID=A0AA39WUN9_9PEZI|nr:hypothetical protein B0T17DRAFT_535435 [Bombardia bombarda]